MPHPEEKTTIDTRYNPNKQIGNEASSLHEILGLEELQEVWYPPCPFVEGPLKQNPLAVLAIKRGLLFSLIRTQSNASRKI